jgi:nitrogen regulatory protein P-II 2
MHLVKLKRVTVISEDVLEKRIVKALMELGAKGYTVDTVRGGGEAGLRDNAWEGENVRIVTVVAPEVAYRMAEHLVKEFFTTYHGIVYLSDVEVVRGERFV